MKRENGRLYSSSDLSADRNNQEMVSDRDPPALPTVFNALSVTMICSPQFQEKKHFLSFPYTSRCYDTMKKEKIRINNAPQTAERIINLFYSFSLSVLDR